MSERPDTTRWSGVSGTKMIALCKLESETQPLGTEEHDTEWGPRMYARLPYDFPAYIRVMRRILEHVTKSTVSGDLLGWTWELDLYTHHIKVWVRVDRDPRVVKVFIEDETGRKKVYQK